MNSTTPSARRQQQQAGRGDERVGPRDGAGRSDPGFGMAHGCVGQMVVSLPRLRRRKRVQQLFIWLLYDCWRDCHGVTSAQRGIDQWANSACRAVISAR